MLAELAERDWEGWGEPKQTTKPTPSKADPPNPAKHFCCPPTPCLTMQHGLCTAKLAHAFLHSPPVACPTAVLTWKSKGNTFGTPPGPHNKMTSQNRAMVAKTWSRSMSKGETKTRTQTLLIYTTQFWPPHTNPILVLLLLPFREYSLTSTHCGSSEPIVTSAI